MPTIRVSVPAVRMTVLADVLVDFVRELSVPCPTFFRNAYRVIYRQIDQQVVIYVIADGRRDMQSLLARRLLAG